MKKESSKTCMICDDPLEICSCCKGSPEEPLETCECGRPASYFNIKKINWFYCENCRLVWAFGVNLFSSWRFETEEEWMNNLKQFKDYNIKNFTLGDYYGFK
ncbi:MAG: hypothetical protein KUA33_04560 [Methanobacterium sp.]|nr:hypothetical protein [Methanobacterium sp.]MBV1754859.1 hypothetical protein [Methanobacterium sp.]